MLKKCLLTLAVAAAPALAGCAGGPGGPEFPGPRPLGSEFEVYQAPAPTDEVQGPAGRVEEPAGDIALRDALGLALLGSPELAAHSWAVRAAEARELGARQVPNPEIEVELEDFGGVGETAGFQGAVVTLMLGQLLETGGKRAKRGLLAASERDLQRWDYEAKRLDVLTDAAAAFIGVLSNQERLSVAEESHRLSRRVLEAVGERVRAGKVPPLEETRAEVEAEAAGIEVERVRNKLEASRRRLAATWGGEKPVFGRALGDLTLVHEVPPMDPILEMLSQSPEIARWSTELEVHSAALDLEESLRIPDLALGAGMRRVVDYGVDTYILSLSFDLPVFDRNQGGIREARCNLARAEEDSKAAGAGVLADLAEAYLSLTSSYTEATSLATTVLPAAQRAFEATGEGYRQGKFNYLEVLDAQRTLFDVKASYIDALEAYHLAVTVIERIVGSPLGGLHHNTDHGEGESR